MQRTVMVACMLVRAAWCGAQTLPATRPLVLVTRLPEEARIGQVVGREVVAHWWEVEIEAQALGMDPAATKKATWEIRTGDGKRVVCDVAMPWDMHFGGSKVTGNTARFTLTEQDVKALEREGDGIFLAAWMIDGERRSNVVKVVIDSKHEMAAEKRCVQLVVGEPPAAGMPPTLGVTVVRRMAEEPELPVLYVQHPRWFVDDQWVVPTAPSVAEEDVNRLRLGVGQSTTRLMTSATHKISLEPGVPHKVLVVVEHEESGVVTVMPGTPLGDAWDCGAAAVRSGAAGGERNEGKR
jgi:hypothetical protein